jgi:hypothetical protein
MTDQVQYLGVILNKKLDWKAHRENRMLGNGYSYVLNFGHSEVLIRMTDETPLLLASRNKIVTFNIFDRKFSVDFPIREDCTGWLRFLY